MLGEQWPDRSPGSFLELLPVRTVHAPAGGRLCYHMGGHPLRRKPTERETEPSDGERGREEAGMREPVPMAELEPLDLVAT